MTVVSAGPGRLRAAIAAAAAAGPFFQLAVLGDPPPPEWAPAGDDVAGLVARTAAQLGTRESRVAASILQLDLAARLWSPVLGCGLLGGVVPDLSALLIDAGPPVRLGLARPAGWAAAGPGELAGLSARTVGAGLRLIAAVLPVRLAPGLLRGNSASAMAGALGVLVRAQPGLAAPARTLASLLLRTRELRGAGVLTSPGAAGLGFRRQSCCLYYRVPGGGLCGDCCLEHPP